MISEKATDATIYFTYLLFFSVSFFKPVHAHTHDTRNPRLKRREAEHRHGEKWSEVFEKPPAAGIHLFDDSGQRTQKNRQPAVLNCNIAWIPKFQAEHLAQSVRYGSRTSNAVDPRHQPHIPPLPPPTNPTAA